MVAEAGAGKQCRRTGMAVADILRQPPERIVEPLGIACHGTPDRNFTHLRQPPYLVQAPAGNAA